MHTYHITYKHGLQNPIDIVAKDEVEAKKLGFAHHLKNSGFAWTCDLLATFENTIDTVTEIA